MSIINELREIIEYYNDCHEGLGEEFLEEFESQVLKIAKMPTRWSPINEHLRKSLMKRFPFLIYFRIIDNKLIRILVVKHQKHHPNYGIDRK